LQERIDVILAPAQSHHTHDDLVPGRLGGLQRGRAQRRRACPERDGLPDESSARDGRIHKLEEMVALYLSCVRDFVSENLKILSHGQA
jgi:hypothetical protein